MNKYQVKEIIGGICGILCFFIYPILLGLIG